MHTLYLLLGGNIGDRLQYLNNAKIELEKQIGKCVNQSGVYETKPWGFEHCTFFLNQLLVITTTLAPHQVLDTILEIEQKLGRVRNGATLQARTIDIDILFYDSVIIKDNFLEIPHPRIAERKFALVPLSEVNNNFMHPVYYKTMHQLLVECNDQLQVEIYQKPLQNAL